MGVTLAKRILPRGSRLGVLTGLSIALLPPAKAAAQTSIYSGLVTNHGRISLPGAQGVTGTLTLQVEPDDQYPFDGEVIIGRPLGGSGHGSFWLWSDSMVCLSVSATGDTIVWLAGRVGDTYTGSYLVQGGPFKDQGGRWTVRLSSGPGAREGKEPAVAARDWLTSSLAVLERSTKAPVLANTIDEAFAELKRRTAESLAAAGTDSASGNPFDGSLPEATRQPTGSSGSSAPATIAPSNPPPVQAGSQGPPLGTGDRVALGLLVIGAVGGIWLVATRRKGPGENGQASPQADAPASSSAEPPRWTGGYAIRCPTCHKGNITEARTLWFVQGLVVAIRYGQRTIIGCPSCVKQEWSKSFGLNLLLGWWSAVGVFATPIVLVQNLVVLAMSPSAGLVEDMLKKAGLDPDDLRLDSEGFTREQRRLVEAASYVLATAIWADGKAEPVEYARALHILQNFADGRLTPEAAAAVIAAGRDTAPRLDGLSVEMRDTLLRMALDIALSDGYLGLAEIAMLHSLAERMGVPKSAIEDLMAEMTGARRAESERQESASSRQNSQRADEDPGPRRPRRGPEDLGRARTVLGVTATATLIEVKKAYREAIFTYHPDRAGPDAKKQAEYTKRTQELNWAYSALRRAAEAELQN